MCELLIFNLNIATGLSRHMDSSSMLLFHESTEKVLSVVFALTFRCVYTNALSYGATVGQLLYPLSGQSLFHLAQWSRAGIGIHTASL